MPESYLDQPPQVELVLEGRNRDFELVSESIPFLGLVQLEGLALAVDVPIVPGPAAGQVHLIDPVLFFLYMFR